MKSIAIDFDGVIHSYEKGWQDGSIYGQPIRGVFGAIQELMKDYTVFIFSTRKPRQIKQWLMQHIMDSSFGDNPNDPQDWSWPIYGFEAKIIPFWIKFWNKKDVLGITNRKLPAEVYIDDRALTFTGSWTDTLKAIQIFKTYQQK